MKKEMVVGIIAASVASAMTALLVAGQINAPASKQPDTVAIQQVADGSATPSPSPEPSPAAEPTPAPSPDPLTVAVGRAETAATKADTSAQAAQAAAERAETAATQTQAPAAQPTATPTATATPYTPVIIPVPPAPTKRQVGGASGREVFEITERSFVLVNWAWTDCEQGTRADVKLVGPAPFDSEKPQWTRSVKCGATGSPGDGYQWIVDPGSYQIDVIDLPGLTISAKAWSW
jgi:hypothetical protein